MNLLTPAAAISTLRKRTVVRVYAETPALKLLGIEDKYDARLKWKAQVGRQVFDQEKKTLDQVREELAKRLGSEMDEAKREFRKRNKVWDYFPDEGPYRRELYPKHMDVIRYTKTDEEVLFMAANKIGKTDLGGKCVAHWAMGRYPDWWDGRVFQDPVTIWIVNKTAKDTRDINEAVLLGPPGNDAERGTGMIPGHLIQHCAPKQGTQHAIEFINVEHVSGATSYIVSKSYDQGREAFQGRNIPVIWDDEEVPQDVAGEQKLRIMTIEDGGQRTTGLILYTYTPILGLTEFTAQFMEDAGLSIDALRKAHEETDEEAA